MATGNSFNVLSPEIDIGGSPSCPLGATAVDKSPNKRRRDDSPLDVATSGPGPQVEAGPSGSGSLCAHFAPTSGLRSRGDRYRWVASVLLMDPFKNIKGALEIQDGRHNIYVKCKDGDILTRITTAGALGEVLVRPRVFGKGQCINLIIFEVPLCVEMQELTEYNPQIVHARRMNQNGNPTQRVIITYEGAKAPKTLKVVEGFMPLRCAIFHSLTPFCSHCSKWGHSARACPRDSTRCMYCACPHASKECAEKIALKEVVPRRCVNCRHDHNANSPLCMFYPKDRKKKNVTKKLSVPPSQTVPPIGDINEFPTLPTPRGGTSMPKIKQVTSSSPRPVKKPVVSRKTDELPPQTHSQQVSDTLPSQSHSQPGSDLVPTTASPTPGQDDQANIASFQANGGILQSITDMLQVQAKMFEKLFERMQLQISQQQQQFQEQLIVQQQQFQEQQISLQQQFQERLLAHLHGTQQQQAIEDRPRTTERRVLSTLFGNN